MSFSDWIKGQLEGCRPALREAGPAMRESILSFWTFLRGDLIFFGFCGLIIGLFRWFWPAVGAGAQPEPALAREIFSSLAAVEILAVFIFATLILIGLSSLIPRTFLLAACDQTTLRIRQVASVITAFLLGYGLIVMVHGIVLGLPVMQQVLSVILYVLVVPVVCILFTAPNYFRGDLCRLLAWVLILAGLLGIFLSLIRS
ncbi:hypothetical protein [Geoalkalibacter halelectricus]|uniref:Yip1 domain-containing protein n=1 Tax=Geoalkalibacter halelectricus TaxID=2847045 RepID=A0ABY5ZKF9_9BACT|nr:hypothetical protein [Geoalkalibacter halelectricus]MDO3376860.1 hypothetical protein [Geoalkalibacter halelectricus]UWZ79618.1 hypothetical protein L9S41_18345 [Geoalkalibacter halelectricus]